MKAIGLLFTFIFLCIFRLLGLLFKYKALLVIVVIGVVIFLFVGTRSGQPGTANPQTAIPKYQTLAPPANIAPKVIQTTSRVYYVAAFADNGKTVTMMRYYSYDKDKWQLNIIPLTLTKADIKIYDRGKT